jgi:hypothetical protein
MKERQLADITLPMFTGIFRDFQVYADPCHIWLIFRHMSPLLLPLNWHVRLPSPLFSLLRTVTIHILILQAAIQLRFSLPLTHLREYGHLRIYWFYAIITPYYYYSSQLVTILHIRHYHIAMPLR